MSLGDGFHDRRGPSELSPDLFDRLCGMTRQRRWVWVTGNHDPVVPLALGGAAVAELAVDGLVLRHAPTGEVGEIVGHLHPKARLHTSRRHLRSPLLRRRRRPPAAAGLRQLYRRPQRA